MHVSANARVVMSEVGRGSRARLARLFTSAKNVTDSPMHSVQDARYLSTKGWTSYLD